MRLFLPANATKGSNFESMECLKFSSSLFCYNENFSWDSILNPSKNLDENLAKKVEQFHDNGVYINYIFDPTCLGNIEFIGSYYNKFIDHFKFLSSIGIDYITLSIPYFIEIILAGFPSLTPVLSMNTDIDCIQRIQFYEKLGVNEFILTPDHNRDFILLKELSKLTTSSFHLVLNSTDIYGSPYHRSYLNSMAHCFSEKEKEIVRNRFNVALEYYSRPEELIKSRWIRPEDLEKYINLGFEDFHIIGEYKNISHLKTVLHAYENRHFRGNLFQLLNYDLSEKLKLSVDNSKISKDFLDNFNNDCRFSDCSICGYCQKIAQTAVSDKTQNGTVAHAENMLKTGDISCALQ